MPVVDILPDGQLRLDAPVALPDVLDMLIVGGGPAGTAAAFRAKELGLAALVIDLDDLMKRIRDYSKDKLILPDFGGGDQMPFPGGDTLIEQLHFAPIDKDEMCHTWKSFYQSANIPAQVGIELTGIEQQSDATWLAHAWNHRTKAQTAYRARHIVLAIGRGVPRRFDIPGNTDGIAFRLDDAALYLGAPACVIGGGTSSAEAVIAISNAKAAAQDPSAIFWAYRGDKMPRVSRALSEVFFDAYVGNGNIRYYPNSEPVAVVTGEDRCDYLSIRIDRKTLSDRPSETAHLEFRKERCVACIGEDIPEGFLNTLGIHMVTGGPRHKKRMVVTPLLESQQPNVYLAGDMLSQAHLETDDFAADPATFREVKHRGNIKSALRDGVLVAEVVQQKLAGKTQIQIAPDLQANAPAPVEAPVPEEQTILRTLINPLGTSESKAESGVPATGALLIRLTPAGVEEGEFELAADTLTTIGRTQCDLSFPDDPLLSDHHASIVHSQEGFLLRDDGGSSGTFLRLAPGRPVPLAFGDLLRLGRQFLVLQQQPDGPTLMHYDHSGSVVHQHLLTEGTMVVGRKAPDLTLDAEDTILSRRHLSVSLRNHQVVAKDLNSLNGTYLRVRDAVPLVDEDTFRVGRQIFRLDLGTPATAAPPPDRATSFVAAPPSKPSVVPEPAPSAAPAGAPSVTFEGTGQTLPVGPGQTLCDAAEHHGVELQAECHAGICGSDPVRILSGGEFLSEMGDEEADTLEDICGLEPGPCRLACMVKTRGPVVVSRVER